ncbi:MAG: galactonate dehydratase [Acidobacteria bacterium]|nr:galactonate dehydratase [Acidobacteriota bacterium]
MSETSRRHAVRAAFTSMVAAGSAMAQRKDVPVPAKDNLKITKLETILVKPRWLFLKIHTNAGIVGLGEPVVEGRALTVATAIKEIEPYLVGKDPRPVAHHWQAIYRHAFYRGGPVLTSALSGIDQALWDIKGKALGVPVYELLGGPTRNRVRVYAHAGTPEVMRAQMAKGFTAFKTGPQGSHGNEMSGANRNNFHRYMEPPAEVDHIIERFADLRKAVGDKADIGIDFHGRVGPALAKVLIKKLEPYNPMFIEEPINCQDHDLMAEIAKGTHIPIATGERVFTKWGFKEVLEKRAATIIQPDLCHAGGITEVRLIAGMAEAYYAAIAPHNPLGPISLAAGLQISASIPNFLIQEQVSLGEGYLKNPLKVSNGYLELPALPGLGVELDENAMADKIGHDWRNPETYDKFDGSVTDW